MAVGDENVAHAISVLRVGSRLDIPALTACRCGGMAAREAPTGGELLASLFSRMDGASAWRCRACGCRYSPMDDRLPARGMASLADATPAGRLSHA